MGKKYYVVKKGLVPGIYTSWAECERNVKGFPGAVFKGFATKEEAKAFMGGGAKGGTAKSAEAVAYVDGSYNAATKEYACGVVIFYDGKEEHISRSFSDAGRAAMRNVAGEIEGAMCAMEFCLEHGMKSLDIYYDYEGIEKWCTGEWKANKEGTKAYRSFYEEAGRRVKIRFIKVKGHSGNKYNDLADALAKAAIGIE